MKGLLAAAVRTLPGWSSAHYIWGWRRWQPTTGSVPRIFQRDADAPRASAGAIAPCATSGAHDLHREACRGPGQPTLQLRPVEPRTGV